MLLPMWKVTPNRTLESSDLGAFYRHPQSVAYGSGQAKKLPGASQDGVVAAIWSALGREVFETCTWNGHFERV